MQRWLAPEEDLRVLQPACGHKDCEARNLPRYGNDLAFAGVLIVLSHHHTVRRVRT